MYKKITNEELVNNSNQPHKDEKCMCNDCINELIERTINYIEYKQCMELEHVLWENEKEDTDSEMVSVILDEISDTREIIEGLKTIKN